MARGFYAMKAIMVRDDDVRHYTNNRHYKDNRGNLFNAVVIGLELIYFAFRRAFVSLFSEWCEYIL